jgi:hypothetical protein
MNRIINQKKQIKMKTKCIIPSVSYIVGLLVILFYLFGCITKQYDGVETITINPKATTNRTNITIKSILPLETSDSTLIGDITTLEYYKDKYYLFDKNISKTLFLFDASGKFRNKIRRGKGPGEIIEPWDFCVDKANNTILLWDQTTFNLNVYDLDLSFIKSIYCPRIAIRNLCCLKDEGSFLIFSQFFPIDKGEIVERVLYDYFVYSNNFKTLTQKIHQSDPKTRLISIDNAISKAESKFFIAPIDNNIYELSEDRHQKSIYKFDLGKYQITDDDLEKGYKFYRPEIKKGNRIGPLSDLFINDRYVSVSFPFRGQMEYHIFNRNQHEGFFSGDPNLKKQIPQCRIKGLTEDHVFIGTVNAMDYKKYLDNKGANSKETAIDIFSNQIILMFTID